MPQMAPISWLLLFFIFSFTFIMFNILNYYCFFSKMPQQPNLNKTSESFNSMNWKW